MDMSDVSFSRAAGAYSDALKAANNLLSRLDGGADETQSAKGGNFMDMVGSALQGAASTGYKSESMATKALSGKADLTDVITAVTDAETALNTVVAIRDRVITAYQDIIKMPI